MPRGKGKGEEVYEGRQKDHPGNIPASVGKEILFDFIDYEGTGFNPYDLKNLGSRQHYKSKDTYHSEVKYENFRALATKLAVNARAIRKKGSHDLFKNRGVATGPLVSVIAQSSLKAAPSLSLKSMDYFDPRYSAAGAGQRKMQRNSQNVTKRTSGQVKSSAKSPTKSKGNEIALASSASSNEGPLMCQYPDGRIFLQFDFDGDVQDLSANEIKFSPCGCHVYHYSRVPTLVKNSGAMLNLPFHQGSVAMDPFQMLIQKKIQDNNSVTVEDERGFELRSTVKLPYPCRSEYYDNVGNKINTYWVSGNSHGYVFAFFWLTPLNGVNGDDHSL